MYISTSALKEFKKEITDVGVLFGSLICKIHRKNVESYFEGKMYLTKSNCV